MMLKGFLSGLSFYTSIPISKDIEFNEDNFQNGFLTLPIIGLLIGFILFIISILLNMIFIDPIKLGFILMLAYLVLTGGLHFDGLSDTSDGMFSQRSKEKTLQIMKDSRIGAFGGLSISIALIGYTIFFSEISTFKLLTFSFIPRLTIFLIISIFSKSATSGLGELFINKVKSKKNAIIFWYFTSTAIVIFTNPKFSLNIIILLLSVYFMDRYFTKRIEGQTGDTIGFMIEITQLIYLL
jgi:adenosylcobinamide-GDP ribazoletransferase